jgi:predicted MFS family arabinose efflux permease
MEGEKHQDTNLVLEPAEEPWPEPLSPADHNVAREPEEKRQARYTVEDVESQRPTATLHQVRSHVSTHDATNINNDPHYEAGDEIYDKFSPRRKIVIVSVLSFCSFLAPISSTSILAASPEVVATYHTTGAIFNVSNALYMVFMGLSPLLYGPMGQTYGRKWTLAVSAVTFTAFSLGSALAPNLASYFVFRMLTAFQGTSFLIVGGTVIGDIYRPIERGTAYGWFLSGTLIGPALGPFIGGIIVTFVSWRNIFWLQTALAGAASVAVILLVPETIHRRKAEELVGLTRSQQARKLWSWVNPWRVGYVISEDYVDPFLCEIMLTSRQ